MHKRLSLCVAAVLLTAIFCSVAIAASVSKNEKTQGEFAIQLCKALGLEVPAGDYIAQLNAHGVAPEGGWQADKPMSNSEMASLLAKALGLGKEIETRVALKIEEAYRDKATVVNMEGNVNVKMGEAGNWIPAQVGLKLTQADSIKTGPGSWVELRVGMVGGIRVKENSEVNLSQLSSTPDGRENIILFMNIGEMLVDVRGIATGSDFQVRTPTTVAAVRGTIYNVKCISEKTEVLPAE